MAKIIDNNSNLNNETLLFTRLAENEINNGNIEKAIDILQNHNPYPLPDDAPKEMSKIVKEFEKELKGGR